MTSSSSPLRARYLAVTVPLLDCYLPCADRDLKSQNVFLSKNFVKARAAFARMLSVLRSSAVGCWRAR